MRLSAWCRATQHITAALVLVSTTVGCHSGPPRDATDNGLSGVTIVTALASDAQRVALVQRFIEAFNRGDRSALLALMGDGSVVSDCDYTNAAVVDVAGRDQVSAWLDSRIADHDRFATELIENSNTDESAPALGVTFARRSNDSLRKLGFTAGIRPQLAAKVRFSGSGQDQRIEAFANGPVGGDASKLCRAA